MCGIIGYVGPRECKALLLLRPRAARIPWLRLRGDRAARAGGALYTRAVGNLQNLKLAAGENGSPATTGLGHTRWATHGGVTPENAHPLAVEDAYELAIVLNGIVENYRDLRERLRAQGHVFSSETDAETVTHLIEEHYDGDLVEATRLAFNELEGHFAFVAIHRDHPGLLVGARHQCPLVVGIGDGETFLASNASAFLRETREVHFPEDGDLVAITRDGAAFLRAADGSPVERELVVLDWDDESAEKAGFETFMLKEIYEQPEAVAETIGDRVRHGRLELDGLLDDDALRVLRRIVILSAGTSYHAAVAGRYAIEEWARVPVEHDIASEWIYRNPVLDRNTLVIGISQSGETRDTISGDEARPRDGRAHGRDHEHDGLADHPRGRLGPLHARRARGQRRRLEDVHGPGQPALPRRAQARAGAGDDAEGRVHVHPRRGLRAARRRSSPSSTATTRSTRSPSGTSTSPSSSTSAATSACRWRWRGR